MQVSVESINNLERKIQVTMADDGLDAKIEKRLNEMKSRVRMDGFRPGKIPMNIMKQRYGEGVKHEMLNELVAEGFYKATNDENIQPAGFPKFESVDTANGEITFVATFEVYPEVKLADLSSLNVEKFTSEIGDEDVDSMMAKLQEQRQTWEEATRQIRKDDRVTVDFTGTMEGEEFEGGTATDVPIVIGSGSMIKGFETKLKGMKTGETADLELSFPKDYHVESLAGKPVTFNVTIKKVEKPVVPEIDEEFVKSLGVEAGTEEALRTEVSDNMKRELERALESKNKENAMTALLEANAFDVPASLVSREAEQMMQQMKQRFQAQGMDASQFPMQAEMFNEEAERRVKLGLLMQQLVKDLEITLDQERVAETIESYAASYEEPEQVRNWYNENPQRKQEVEAVVMEAQVMDEILAKANITETAKAFDELVGQQ